MNFGQALAARGHAMPATTNDELSKMTGPVRFYWPIVTVPDASRCHGQQVSRSGTRTAPFRAATLVRLPLHCSVLIGI